MNNNTPSDVASKVISKARETGFTVSVSGSVLSVRKSFTPGDSDAYTMAECDANSILGMVKRTEPGSTWGTDGGSIGGHVGLKGGYMELHKSGCSKRILSAIAKGC
jgi:hypothetical protein